MSRPNQMFTPKTTLTVENRSSDAVEVFIGDGENSERLELESGETMETLMVWTEITDVRTDFLEKDEVTNPYVVVYPTTPQREPVVVTGR